MPGPSQQLERFIKLMMLTTSTNDNEVLTSIRMANAELYKLNRNWEELIRGKVSIIQDPTIFPDDGTFSKPKTSSHRTDSDIPIMLDALLHTSLSNSAEAFINSLADFYETKNFLTENQYNALKKFYSNRR